MRTSPENTALVRHAHDFHDRPGEQKVSTDVPAVVLHWHRQHLNKLRFLDASLILNHTLTVPMSTMSSKPTKTVLVAGEAEGIASASQATKRFNSHHVGYSALGILAKALPEDPPSFTAPLLLQKRLASDLTMGDVSVIFGSVSDEATIADVVHSKTSLLRPVAANMLGLTEYEIVLRQPTVSEEKSSKEDAIKLGRFPFVRVQIVTAGLIR